MKARRRLLTGVAILLSFLIFWPSRPLLASSDTSVDKAETVALPPNTMKFSKRITPAELVTQIKSQYKYSFPKYNGTITAYTNKQYHNYLDGKTSDYISPSYISLLDNRLKQVENFYKYNFYSSGNNLNPVTNYDVSPYSAVGINSTWFNLANGMIVINSPYLESSSVPNPSTTYEGSTSFGIGANRIASAAHCFYDADAKKYPDGGITLWGDANVNGHPRGVTAFTSFKIPSSYSNGKDFSNDYAAAIVQLKSGSLPSTLSLSTSTSNNTQASSIGYPGDPQAGTPYDSQGQMVFSSGTVFPDPDDPIGLYQSSSVRAYHGMSGGPLLDPSSKVIGINVYEYSPNDVEIAWGFKRMTPSVVSFLLNS